VDLTAYLRRHHCGDWGEELCADDKQANEDALVDGKTGLPRPDVVKLAATDHGKSELDTPESSQTWHHD